MNRPIIRAVSVLILVVMVSCASHGPAEIHYGQDLCDYCKMTIADRSFGSELVTSKGKVYKFDSIECLAAYTQVSSEDKAEVNSLWVTDFKNAGSFVEVDKAIFIVSESQNSPMGVGLLAFGSGAQAEDFISEIGGRKLNWPETCDLVKRTWKL